MPHDKPSAPDELREAREYLLGTDAPERARLGFQHQVWAEPTARLWERAGFGPGTHDSRRRLRTRLCELRPGAESRSERTSDGGRRVAAFPPPPPDGG
jgi:hypothetical protein